MVKSEYLILRHEKAWCNDLVPSLALKRTLSTRRFAENNSPPISELHEHNTDATTTFVLVLQKLLCKISLPLALLGFIVEFFLNLFSINGGVLGVLWRTITLSVVIPWNRDAPYFRSLIGHIDGRYGLHTDVNVDNLHDHPLEPLVDLNVGPINLSIMASKLSYENEAFIRSVVNNQWKMHFVKFFSCYNKYLKDQATQAFIFTDKPDDANLIVLAFRGTEPFNAIDWITDIDLSWLSICKIGRVHLGFMRALGLQDEKDCDRAFPRELPAREKDKPLAYYAIRKEFKSLLAKHENAKILITGHSLGGALAVLFPAILSLHDEQSILDRIYGVITYGQPRVGDAVFRQYMQSVLGERYHRIVYRYDIVPRVPFDKPPVAEFKHFGTCIYFKNWYEGEVVDESPNRNYMDPLHLLSMHISAVEDLVKALYSGMARAKDFEESYVSLFFRVCGVFLPGVAFHSPRDYANGGKMARFSKRASQQTTSP